MKRFIAFLAAFAAVITLAACGEEKPTPPPEDKFSEFSGYCVSFSYPEGWSLYEVNEEHSLVKKAVFAVNEDETIALKLYCTGNGPSALVIRADAENAQQIISRLRSTLEATVTPQATFNNLQSGVITIESLLKEGKTLPEYDGELINDDITDPSQLTRVTAADDGTLAAALDASTGLWGYVNKLGEYVIAPRFFEALDFSEELAAVKSGGTVETATWGYITRSGSFAAGLEPRYTSAGEFSQGLALVSDGENGLYYINTDGSMAITAFGLEVDCSIDFFATGFASASDFKNNYALVAISDISHAAVAYLIDINGNVCCQIGTDLAAQSFDSDFSLSADGYVIYKTGSGYYGVKDNLGISIIAEMYDYISPYSGGLMAASLSGRYGYIDFSGSPVVPMRYEQATAMSQHGGFVKSGERWGIISADGTTSQMSMFEGAVPYVGDVACVMDGGLWALIDAGGSFLTPYIFDYAPEFIGDTGWFVYNGMVGALNAKGEVFIEPQFTAARGFF